MMSGKFYFFVLIIFGVGTYLIHFLYRSEIFKTQIEAVDTRIDKTTSEAPVRNGYVLPILYNLKEWNQEDWRTIALSYSFNSSHYLPFDSINDINLSFKRSAPFGKKGSASINTLIIVKSEPHRYELRMAIRDTWGGQAIRLGFEVLFIIGNSADNEINNRISVEFNSQSDILLGDFDDTYHNLTLKSMLSYKFASENCSQIKYFIKTDDDVYVNVKLLQSSLANLESYSMAGYPNSRIVGRNKNSKWYVPQYIYPWVDYPKYLAGAFLIVTKGAVNAISYSSLNLPYYYIDDVYETGMLRTLKSIKLVDYGKFIKFGGGYWDSCDIIVSLQIKHEQMREISKKMNAKEFECKR